MINYFNPLKEQTLLEKQKAYALKWIMVSLFFLLAIVILHAFYAQTFTSVSDYFLPIGQVFVICVLFILRLYGLRKAGNFFSYGAVLIMLVVINIFDNDTVFTKYTEEFYLAIFVLVFISLFASRKILLLSSALIFISSLRVYFYLLQNSIIETDMLLEIQIFFSFTLINTSLILYFVTKFSDNALDVAYKDAKIKENQNIALEIERQRAEKSELLYKSIFNNLIGGFYKTDEKGNIVLLSPSVTLITGFEEKDLFGQVIASFFVDLKKGERFLEEIKTNGKVELYKTEFKTKQKGNIFVEINAKIVLNSEGEFNGIEGIFYDITEQNKLEIELVKYKNNLELLVKEKTEELETSNEELKSTNEELYHKGRIINEKNNELGITIQDLKETQSQLVQSEKMASLGILTAGVAHELNNPLNFIMGSYNGLKNYFNEKKISDKTINVFLNSLETGVNRSISIINGLNEFSRSKESNDEKCNINKIIDNCLLMLSNQYKHRIEIIKNYAIENPEVYGNSGKLHQVFLNILTNSIQAIEEKGVISLSTKVTANKVIIKISDTGIGISEENISKITDPFFTTKDPGKGTGLGLSISYSIIKDHKGDIDFTSKQNKGTLITISLPINYSENKER